MGLFDKLLDIGCAFDWITPLKALVVDSQHMTDFTVPEDCDYLISGLAGQLTNPMYVNGSFMFQVPDAMAGQVARRLRDAKIPYTTDKGAG